jgi:type II secretory pathway component HofQ
MVLKIIAEVKEINPQPVVASDTTTESSGIRYDDFPPWKSLKSLVDTN